MIRLFRPRNCGPSRFVSAFVIALAFTLRIPEAKADELARNGNLALIASLADTYTTRQQLRIRGGVENNPVARPFVQSDLTAYGTTVALNFALRRLFWRAPRVMLGVALVEAGLACKNELGIARQRRSRMVTVTVRN